MDEFLHHVDHKNIATNLKRQGDLLSQSGFLERAENHISEGLVWKQRTHSVASNRFQKEK